MDIQELTDKQMLWLRNNAEEGKGFFVVKEMFLKGSHFCKLADDTSQLFTCQFHCRSKLKCAVEKRHLKFANGQCGLYEGPRDKK